MLSRPTNISKYVCIVRASSQTQWPRIIIHLARNVEKGGGVLMLIILPNLKHSFISPVPVPVPVPDPVPLPDPDFRVFHTPTDSLVLKQNFAVHLYDVNTANAKWGTKRLINRRNDIKQGWQFCSPLKSPWKRKGKKRKLSQHGVFVVDHPAKYYPRRIGLNFDERTDHVAVLVV